MDISINSGKYAKKEDLKIIADSLTEMAEVIDNNQEIIDRKIKLVFKFMIDVVGDVIEDYQSFNELWIERTLNEKYRAAYRKEAQKYKKAIEDKVTKKANIIVSEFNAKV